MFAKPNLIKRLPINRKGRCLVATDVHFQTKKLQEALDALHFDPELDRLIIAGDLIDRGPYWRQALALLEKPYVEMIIGNHEQMIIDAWKARQPYSSHGAGWWMQLTDESQAMVARKLQTLPYVIEIESERGMVGVVHANVPTGLTWKDFTARIHEEEILQQAIWERDRITRHDRRGVEGIWRVCIGHTYLSMPQRLDNVVALDCTTGNGRDLALYCVQDDTVYVRGKPALFEGLPRLKAAALEHAIADPLSQSQAVIQIEALEDDIHELLSMNNALIGAMYKEPEDRRAYLERLALKLKDSRVGPLLDDLIKLVLSS